MERSPRRLAVEGMDNSWVRAAILSSAVPQTAEILKAVMTVPASAPGRSAMIDQLIATAAGQDNPAMLVKVLAAVAPQPGSEIQDWHFRVLKSLIDSLNHKKLTLASLAAAADSGMRETISRLQSIFVVARAVATEPRADEGTREITIQLLGHDAAHQEEDLQLLGNLLKPANPLAVQKAALETLKHNTNSQVPGLLLGGWKQLSPSLRAPILEILLSREESTRALLDALQHRVIRAGEITAANRQRLLANPNQEIQRQAAAILKIGATSSRAEVMAKYAGVAALTGEPEKGKQRFIKNCTPCHFLKGQGNIVGPDLSALADKTPGDFILAILDPSAVIEPRFIAYNIDTRDDRSLTGIISAESSTSLTLTQAGGIKETILRSDITEIKASSLSLMPEGFEQAMNQQDLADLISYLKKR
jgi:putative heme-binding domain-containing protein